MAMMGVAFSVPKGGTERATAAVCPDTRIENTTSRLLYEECEYKIENVKFEEMKFEVKSAEERVVKEFRDFLAAAKLRRGG
jgi:predicted nucleic acid-binding protein